MSRDRKPVEPSDQIARPDSRQQPRPAEAFEATHSDAKPGADSARSAGGERAPGDSPDGMTLPDKAVPSSKPDGGQSGVAARDVYEIVRPIGEGGMGSVSLARDPRLDRWVALKRLSPQRADDARLLQRFRIEGRAAAALNHFHIVRVHAMGEDDDGPYIAMEYVAGPDRGEQLDWPEGLPHPPLSLAQLVKREGTFSVTETLELGVQLCSALGYAHKRGVIHRDVKPGNVLIDEEDNPKLADFGIAKQTTSAGDDRTLIGARILTLDYGAPEQEIDASTADHRADLFALGGTLWYAMTGESPRRFRESEVPEPLRPILTKALQKDRERRYQTAEEMAATLQEALEEARDKEDNSDGAVDLDSKQDEDDGVDTASEELLGAVLGPVENVDFGRQLLGRTLARYLTLHNDGDTVLKCVLTAQQPWLRVSEQRIEIPPWTRRDVPVEVVLESVDLGVRQGDIRVRSNGGSRCVQVTVDVVEPQPPCFVFGPSTVDLRKVDARHGRRFEITVSNTGDECGEIEMAASPNTWLQGDFGRCEVPAGDRKKRTFSVAIPPSAKKGDCLTDAVEIRTSRGRLSAASIPVRLQVFDRPGPLVRQLFPLGVVAPLILLPGMLYVLCAEIGWARDALGFAAFAAVPVALYVYVRLWLGAAVSWPELRESIVGVGICALAAPLVHYVGTGFAYVGGGLATPVFGSVRAAESAAIGFGALVGAVIGFFAGFAAGNPLLPKEIGKADKLGLFLAAAFAISCGVAGGYLGMGPTNAWLFYVLMAAAATLFCSRVVAENGREDIDQADASRWSVVGTPIAFALVVFGWLGTPGLPRTATSGDGDFAAWSLTGLASPGSSSQPALRAEGGNPGRCLESTTTTTIGPIAYNLFLDDSSTWDPARQGQIVSVAARLDTKGADAGRNGEWVALAVRQDGRSFLAPLETDSMTDTGGQIAWHQTRLGPFTSSHFGQLMAGRGGLLTIDSSARPDFSPAGAPLVFGFATCLKASRSTTQLYDNWSMTLKYHTPGRRSAKASDKSDGSSQGVGSGDVDSEAELPNLASLGYRSALRGRLKTLPSTEAFTKALRDQNLSVGRVGRGLWIRGAGPSGQDVWFDALGGMVVAAKHELSSPASLRALQAAFYTAGRAAAAVTAGIDDQQLREAVAKADFFTEKPDQYQRVIWEVSGPARQCVLDWPDAEAIWSELVELQHEIHDPNCAVSLGETAVARGWTRSEAGVWPRCTPLPSVQFGHHSLAVSWVGSGSSELSIDGFFPAPSGRIAIWGGKGESAAKHATFSRELRSLKAPPPKEEAAESRLPQGFVTAAKIGLRSAISGRLDKSLRPEPVRKALEREFGEVHPVGDGWIVAKAGSFGQVGWVFPDGTLTVGSWRELTDAEEVDRLETGWGNLARVVARVTAGLAPDALATHQFLATRMFTPRAGQYQKLTISLIDRGMGRGAGLDNQFCVWPEGPCEWSRYRPYTLRYLRFEGKDLSVKEPGPLPNVVPGEHALSVLKEMYAQPAPGYVVIEGGFSEPQSRITVYDHCGKPSEVRASLSSVLERLYLPDSPFYATIRERATKG